MAEAQTYSHIDIQRYLQHKMSPQEMHDFEKALMDDPFLADAMEGFSASDQVLAEKHLLAVESALTEKREKAKVVPLSAKKTAWWRVAAIVLVVILTGVITYSVFNKNGLSNIEEVQIAAAKPKAVTPLTDSIGPADKPLAETNILPGRTLNKRNNGSPVIYPKKNSLAQTEPMEMKADSASVTMSNNTPTASLMASPTAATAYNNAPAAKQMRVSSNAVIQNEFKGKVLNKLGEPLPFATIKANNNNIATVSDGNGNFTLKAGDSVLKVNINSPGYVSATEEIKTGKPVNNIVLKENDLSLAEVVVTQLNKKKRTIVINAKADTSVAAEPAGGWKNFTQYMNVHLDSLKGIDDENLNEDFDLEFFVDKQGRPVDIKASEDADKLLAEKAISILANGPKWNKKKDKKMKVSIRF